MSRRESKDENRMQRRERRKLEREERKKLMHESSRKDNMRNYALVGLVILLVIVFLYKSTSSSSAYIPDADTDYSIGPSDAPIEIIAFGDLACPYTKKWVESTLDPLLEKYNGKIRLVFRDFPKYDKHPQAQKASEAAECAGEQGKYMEYFRKVFEMQPALSISSLKEYAREAGLDTSKFNECLDSGRFANEVKKDHSDGAKAGVVTTPTFFINGNKMEGAQNLAAFDSVLGQLI